MMQGLMGTLRFAHLTRDRFVIYRMGKGHRAVPISLGDGHAALCPPYGDQEISAP